MIVLMKLNWINEQINKCRNSRLYLLILVSSLLLMFPAVGMR